MASISTSLCGALGTVIFIHSIAPDMGEMYPAEIQFQVGDKQVARYVLSDLEASDNLIRPVYTVRMSDEGGRKEHEETKEK